MDGTMQPGKIGLYIHEVLYNRGGTEAYTVRMAEALSLLFPGAGILRMDADTTKGREGHEKIRRKE